tara:strand:+ start:381 stop:797 length:417 start_codon:yes stop_codon:yes gene_type:complete
MGTTQSKTYKINYEDMIIVIKKNECIINTLLPDEQDCLIKNTINYKLEEKFINDNIKNLSRNIIIYGKNSNDETVHKKYTQLIQLGFTNVFIYTGGMFEWLCLQDIYGSDEFPTTSRELDILKYKALSQFSNNELLTN